LRRRTPKKTSRLRAIKWSGSRGSEVRYMEGSFSFLVSGY
jgi:hypothetical protein